MAAGEAAVKTEGVLETVGWDASSWGASGVFWAQAAPLTIARRVRPKTVRFFFTECPIKDLPIKNLPREVAALGITTSEFRATQSQSRRANHTGPITQGQLLMCFRDSPCSSLRLSGLGVALCLAKCSHPFNPLGSTGLGNAHSEKFA